MQMDCPECLSTHTFPTPETMYERFCGDCEEAWESHREDDESGNVKPRWKNGSV